MAVVWIRPDATSLLLGNDLGSLATGTFHPTRTIAPIGGVIQGERPPGAELINEVVIGGRPRAQAFAEYLHDQIVDRAELIGVAGVNPRFGTEMLEEVRTAATDWGFRDIKFMPLKHDFDGHDAILKPFMELARELGLYVTIHTGPNESQPIKARPLAAAYPEVPILLDHMGMRSWVNQSIELAQAYSNVYLLTTVIAATVKIRPQPKARLYRTFGFQRLADGLTASREIMVSGLQPAAMRLYNKNSAVKVLSEAVGSGIQAQPTLLMTFEGDHPDLTRIEARKASQICKAARGQDLGSAPARKWWDNRYVFYYPPYHPTLPTIWGTLDVVMDYAHAMEV